MRISMVSVFSVPAAAEIPLREPRTWSGNVRDGSMNVVEFGPKLLKKNVRLAPSVRSSHFVLGLNVLQGGDGVGVGG